MAMTDVSALPGFLYRASDGVKTFWSGERISRIVSFSIGTDATGMINAWEITLYSKAWDYQRLPADHLLRYIL